VLLLRLPLLLGVLLLRPLLRLPTSPTVGSSSLPPLSCSAAAYYGYLILLQLLITAI